MIKFSTSVFFRLLAAACGAALTQVLLDFVDCMIVGHVLGSVALAGLELFMPIIDVMCAISLLVAGGTAVLHAEAMGRFDRARADEVFSTGVLVSVLLGLAGAIVLWFGLDAYLGLFGEGEALDAARAYGRAYAAVILVHPPMTLILTMVLEDGDDKLFSVSSVLVFVTNVAVSWFLAHAIGIAGCAWGTLAAVVAALASLFFHFRAKNCSLAFSRRFSVPLAGRILVANPGDALAELMDAGALLFINWFVVRRFGARRGERTRGRRQRQHGERQPDT